MNGSVGCGYRRMANGRARLGLVLMAAMALPGAALAATAPTIANNTFASTPVGQSMTQTVTLTLTSAGAIKSIALATGTASSKEYTLKGVSGCATDGTTVNASGTVCSVSVMYAPLHPGSLAAPNLSRNAQLLFTDGGSNVTAYGLAGSGNEGGWACRARNDFAVCGCAVYGGGNVAAGQRAWAGERSICGERRGGHQRELSICDV